MAGDNKSPVEAAERPPFDAIEDPGTRRKRLKRLFDSIDLNKDGKLSRSELLQRFTQMALHGRAADAARIEQMAATAESLAVRLLSQSDANNDGFVSLDEFCSFMESQEKKMYSLFCCLDVSGDGMLSADEIKVACEKEGLKASEKAVQRFINHVSTNSDHRVSFPEFRAAFDLDPNAIELVGLVSYYTTILDASQGFGLILLPPNSDKTVLAKWMLASAVSGVMAKTVNAPLDRIRVFFQLGGATKLSRHNIKDTLAALAKDGGLRAALWRGNLVACLRVMPESAIRMWAITNTRMVVAGIEKPADGVSISHIPGRFMAGAAGALAANLAIYPFDVVQTRMMATLSRTAANRRHVILSTIGEIRKSAGLAGFYRGLAPSLLSILPFAGINITTFEFLKSIYLARLPDSERAAPPLLPILGMGVVSASVAELITYPASLIKSRLQTSGTQSNPQKYNGLVDCARQVFRETGWRGFYRGLLPTMAKGVPGVGVGVACFEVTRRGLGLS